MNVLARQVALMPVALFWGQALAVEQPQRARPAPASATYSVAGIHAHLFYEELGKIDERDLVTGKVRLWNTIIGEGDAEAPSNTTVVTIDLAGPAFLSGTNGTLSLIAKSDNRLLRHETVKLGQFFSEGPKLSIPFIVVGTGCGTLKLDVELIVKGHKNRLSKSVEYPCGE